MLEVKSFEPLCRYLKATSKKWRRQLWQLTHTWKNALHRRRDHSAQAWWASRYALEVVPIKTNHPYEQRFNGVRSNGFSRPAD